MADAAKITLSLGEAVYTLADDFNAFCELELAFGGLSLNGIIAKLGNPETLSLIDVRTYLRTMLRSDGKPMKPEAVDVICGGLGMDACNKAVSDHLLAHFVKA